MLSDKPQKMTIPYIIDVLRRYTDESHTFTQTEIRKKLEAVHGLKVDRKTVSRNIKDVMLYDDNIRCRICKRNGEELTDDDDDTGVIYTDFYYEHLFSDVELQAMIYNVIFAKHIAAHNKTEIINKLESLSPMTSSHSMRNYIRRDSEQLKECSQLFYNMEELDKAFKEKRLVEFRYAYYKEDMQLHVEDRIRCVFPLGIAEKNNDFYLIGLVCGGKEQSARETINDIKVLIEDAERGTRRISTFRIDRIRDLRVTENEDLSEKEKKLAREMTLKSFSNEWQNIIDYVNQNGSLSSGRLITAKFRTEAGSEAISDAIDYFGKANIHIIPENRPGAAEDDAKKNLLFIVKTNDAAMLEFAKLHAGKLTLLEPDYLRDELAAVFKTAYESISAN